MAAKTRPAAASVQVELKGFVGAASGSEEEPRPRTSSPATLPRGRSGLRGEVDCSRFPGGQYGHLLCANYFSDDRLRCQIRKRLVLRGLFDVVDYQGFSGSFTTLEFEAEAMHGLEDGGFKIVILRVLGRQAVVVSAG